MRILVTQIAAGLSDGEDQVELPAGPSGAGSFKTYDVPDGITTDEAALDWFHTTVPVGCLDDFYIVCVDTIEHVIVVGNPFDGLTIYGPFKTAEHANKWADCNGTTDLDNEDWWCVPLECPEPEEEDES